MFLFCLGFAVVALSQSAAILTVNCCALTAEGFLMDKMNLDLMRVAGGNGYGNSVNFIAGWVAILPLAAGALYISKDFAKAKIALLFFLCYAGLLVYSRAGLILALIGLPAAAVILSIAKGNVRWAVPAVVAFIIAVHLPSGGWNYYASGVGSFFGANAGEIDKPTSGDRLNKSLQDQSGADRAAAVRTGIAIAKANWLTGIGTGIYARIEPEFTSPHSMLILRLAENGLLGLISILILFAFAPIAVMRQWHRRDPLALSAAISATCFAVYAAAFGAAFSDGGLIPWGMGFGLALSCLAIQPRKP
ncbi:O-antigen ligase family protein [Bradyrhizobium barranii subsp. apii]|uniref:O-antigen ligase family protein n=1 Tax=Bradyrhizobium barranii subsp. apii TaxID=2819348 RepID=A0A8T5VFR2_9BRAD|nr:O-antigen ligase family protein [Bradyrhizobium barranii]UPT85170.1 O-antigen ligase family protein [Bradyrhizobium barranii subsp. apii]